MFITLALSFLNYPEIPDSWIFIQFLLGIDIDDMLIDRPYIKVKPGKANEPTRSHPPDIVLQPGHD